MTPDFVRFDFKINSRIQFQNLNLAVVSTTNIGCKFDGADPSNERKLGTQFVTDDGAYRLAMQNA